MKIDALSTQRQQSMTRETGSGARAHVADTNTEFSTELEDQQSSMSREQLEELLKKIDEQGARLTNTPTYDELKEYRSLVKEFVGEAYVFVAYLGRLGPHGKTEGLYHRQEN